MAQAARRLPGASRRGCALARTSAEAARAELDALFTDLDRPSYTTGSNDGWPSRRLGDLCDIRTGVPHGSLKLAMSSTRIGREAVPVVHPRHLRAGFIEAAVARKSDASRLEQYQLHLGDVLCVRTGAMGQTAIARDGESGRLPHTNVLRLRVKEPAELDPAYLLEYLSLPAVQARIRDRPVRSLTTSISTATFSDLEMPCPRPSISGASLARSSRSMNRRPLSSATLLPPATHGTLSAGI